MKRASVTFISPDPPAPPTGGGTRAFHFVKAIAEISDCALFVLFPVNKKDLPEAVNLCTTVHCTSVPFTATINGRMQMFINDLRLMAAPWSLPKNEVILQADYFITNCYDGKNKVRKLFVYLLKHVLYWYVYLLYQKGNALPVKSLERANQIRELKPIIDESVFSSDILWLDFSSLFPFFSNLKKDHASVQIICNAHNIEYKLLESMEATAASKLEKKWYKCQAAAMKKAELKGFVDCDLIITCSENDRTEILLFLPTANVQVIPNGVDTAYFIPHSNPTVYPSLLFTGTMGYEPNRTAVQYFIKNILPYVLRQIPSCKFIIAGANAAEVFKEHQDKSFVEIVSSPLDMRPVYDKAWVIVVPLRSGSGTRLKILEAMAMEKPVVSTPIGAEGIRLKNNTHLFIADDEQGFAQKIILLIENNKKAAEIATAAKEIVLASYSWDKIREMTKMTFLKLAG